MLDLRLAPTRHDACRGDGIGRRGSLRCQDRAGRRRIEHLQGAGMRVAIAEDSLIVREGLARLLEGAGHELVVAVDRADRVLAEIGRTQPEVAVVDIKMPPTFTDEGLRLAATIRQRHPDVGVLVLSQYVASTYATWLLERAPTGVGYLLKDRLLDVDVLLDALERVAAGETVVDPELVRLLLRERSRSGPLVTLTEREREVLALMAQGLSDRGIA